MKTACGLIAAGLLAAALLPVPAQAGSLLGGLITTGSDSGNGSGLISTNNGNIGVGGSNGISVNLGGGSSGGGSGGGSSGSGLVGGLTGGLLGGGSGSGGSTGGGLLGGSGGGLLGGSGGDIGIPGVATVSTGSGSGGGTTIGASLLGGGGTNINLNPLGLLGNGGGINVDLPDLGGVGIGSVGQPGDPGAPGAPGAPGQNGYGYNGGNGYNGYNGYNGSNGSNGVGIPGNISSRLRLILAMLAQREWIQLADGRAICLPGFGRAEISSWLPRKDWSGLNRALPTYANDIATLRQLLANCRSSQQRQALNVRDLNRVIGIDIQNGTPVLYFL